VPPRRAANSRHAGHALRRKLARRRGVPGPRARNARTERCMMEKRPALGKGLSALIPDAPQPTATAVEVDIDLLSPNQYQPRVHIDATGLEQLTQSIKSNGVIQPIVV